MTMLTPVLPKLTEARFQSQVLKYAALMGWRSYHTYRSDHSAAGFPDLVLIRRPRIVFAELKSDRGKLTDDQRAWLVELHACGLEAYLWRPRDIDLITKILR
jgi:hypothetical protein